MRNRDIMSAQNRAGRVKCLTYIKTAGRGNLVGSFFATARAVRQGFIQLGQTDTPSRVLILAWIMTPVIILAQLCHRLFPRKERPMNPRPTPAIDITPRTDTIDEDILRFEPGCFDEFEGTQEELDAAIAAIQKDVMESIKNGEMTPPVLIRGPNQCGSSPIVRKLQ